MRGEDAGESLRGKVVGLCESGECGAWVVGRGWTCERMRFAQRKMKVDRIRVAPKFYPTSFFLVVENREEIVEKR